jgi:hypothetical protein
MISYVGYETSSAKPFNRIGFLILSFYLKKETGQFSEVWWFDDRLCGLVVRFLDYRSGGPGSIPGTTRKKK